MSQFIDRRLNGKNKSAVNRQRFLNRYRKQIKKAVSEAIAKRSITDMNQGEKVTIPKQDITEPTFSYTSGGKRNMTLPGNKEFVEGDKIPRPKNTQAQGESQASDEGEGADDFVFELSKDEFLDIFFDDMELPNLVKTQLANISTNKFINAGYTTTGTPHNISVIRTMRSALGRRISFTRKHKKKLKKLEQELELELDSGKKNKNSNSNKIKIEELKNKIEKEKFKIKRVPFVDDIDIRYRNKIIQPKPSTRAVMFCIMDVSGSMDEKKKEIAKRFFILLYLFLTKSYDEIDLVFIRHHTTAKEVDEQEFFYSRETGGTVVSSALEEMNRILQTRYNSSDWNVYAAQASDGDNWNADSPHCQEILINDIMPQVQYYAYVEILPRHHQSLWRAYIAVKEAFENFAMQNINKATEIYPVLHELFKRNNI